MTQEQKIQIKLDLAHILRKDMGTLSEALDISLNSADYIAHLIGMKLAELNNWD